MLGANLPGEKKGGKTGLTMGGWLRKFILGGSTEKDADWFRRSEEGTAGGGSTQLDEW